MYCGTFGIDTPEGRPVNIRLGTTKELPTKSAARTKLGEIIAEMTKPGAVPATEKRFSQLVAEWKETEGVTLGRSTLKHYSDALQSYVLPHVQGQGNQDHQPQVHSRFAHREIEDAQRVFAQKYADHIAHGLGVGATEQRHSAA
jgi:hypothetical protein